MLSWLRTRSDVEPVSADWVPGATERERLRLARLGGLTAALVHGGADHPAFKDGKLTEWLRGSAQPPETVTAAARELLSDNPELGLASIYGNLVSRTSRRTLGTFFTPPTEVQWMIDRWAQEHPSPNVVADIGAGVGIFTAAAVREWPQSSVWAIDINPITLGLLALRVHNAFALLPASAHTAGVHIELNDFTVWMQDVWPALPGPRLLLGNPPYTRLQLLPMDQRDRLVEAAGGLCGRRSSLSALITAQSFNAIAKNDGMCLLLPAQWLEASYASVLRDHLWASDRRRIEMRLFEDGLFEDATVDAVALMVGPEQDDAQPVVITGADNVELQRVIDRSHCPPEFRSLFNPGHVSSSQATGSSVRLDDFLTVKRGLATGANAFFALTTAEALTKELPADALVPLVRRLLPFPDRITTEAMSAAEPKDKHVLVAITREMEERDEHASAYVAEGKLRAYDQRFLCQDRPVWFDLAYQVQIPDLIVGQSTKNVFRVVENVARAAILNNLYGMTWRGHVDNQTKSDILEWFRSDDGQGALRRAARVQGSGLFKIEPGALSALELPEGLKSRAEVLL